MDDSSTDGRERSNQTSPPDIPTHATTTPPPRLSSRLALLEAVASMDLPFVRQEIAGRPLVFVNDPELIAQVLVAHAASFEKSEFQRRVMGVAEGTDTGLGNGLLTSSNATNKAQRKLLGRAFSPAATRRYVGQVAALARAERDRWADGACIELGEAFMRLSTRVVARTLCSWDLGLDDDGIASELSRVGGLLGRSAQQRRAGWADPSEIERAGAYLEERIMAMVAARRSRAAQPAGEDTRDVIDLLLDAQAQAGSEGADYVVTDRQIRDDLLTLFITGAENPRNALTWTMYLLGRHPEAAQRIRDEVRAAGAEAGDISLETLQRLPYTLQVFKEALRLYPPGYAFGRRAIEDVDLGALTIENGTEVVVSPYALHRRASLYDRPLEFDPSRFDKQREGQRHACAYLPFGVGPRSCIGGGYALMEGHTVLAVLLGSLHLTPAADAMVLPEPRMTLRPSGPVSVVVGRKAPRA